jgi:hypothetical protein
MYCSAMAEPSLDEIQQRHPDWDVRRVFGTLVAVPAGTPVVTASYTSTLGEKLAGIEAAGELVIPDPAEPWCGCPRCR